MAEPMEAEFDPSAATQQKEAALEDKVPYHSYTLLRHAQRWGCLNFLASLLSTLHALCENSAYFASLSFDAPSGTARPGSSLHCLSSAVLTASSSSPHGPCVRGRPCLDRAI